MYIHKDNRQFVEGKQKTLANRGEVYRTIKEQLEISVVLSGSEDNASQSLTKAAKRTSYIGWGCAVGGTFILTLIIGNWGISTNFSFIDWYINTQYSNHVLTLGTMVAAGTLLTLTIAFAFTNILKAKVLLGYAAYFEKLYTILLEKGIILEGSILQVENIGNANIVLHYQFRSPENKLRTGRHFTTEKWRQRFEKNDKVFVLYVNPCLHVLL